MKKRKSSKRISGKVRRTIQKKSNALKKQMRKDKRTKKIMGRKKLKKQLNIPNLCPWKEELLETHLKRIKELDKEKNKVSILKKKKILKQNYEKILLDILEKKNYQENIKTNNLKNCNNQKFLWFKQELNLLINKADVLIEVLDARNPLAFRSEAIEKKILEKSNKKTGKNKKIILLLNKIDLIPCKILHKWIRYLRKKFPVIAFKCNTQIQKKDLGLKKIIKFKQSYTNKTVGVGALLSLLKNYCRSLNLNNSLTVGFFGYPNTGKSSIINSLKRKRVVEISSIPGLTTVIKEIRLENNIRLIDSPGIIMNGNEKDTSLFLRNALRIEQIDRIGAVTQILKLCDKKKLMEIYSIPMYSNTEEFLFYVAQVRGKLKKGGIPCTEETSRIVLQDWNEGRIPFFVSPPIEKDESNSSSISLVSNWNTQFDIDALFYQNHTMAVCLLKEEQLEKKKDFLEVNDKQENTI